MQQVLRSQKMSTSSESAESVARRDVRPSATRRQKMAASALSLTAFGVAYVLSAGPLVGVQNLIKFKPFARCLEVFYLPLVLIVKGNVPVLGPLLKWYVDLFR